MINPNGASSASVTPDVPESPDRSPGIYFRLLRAWPDMGRLA